ncbi:hypothetical protein [Variovorax sp. CF313]|uniref:hypothetical protein n=2 Tax=unclassified Variovorax TaxID=663243 RepID=UPI00138AFF3E|nr:hypothetical protein [Variovorax sp. CF313]
MKKSASAFSFVEVRTIVRSLDQTQHIFSHFHIEKNCFLCRSIGPTFEVTPTIRRSHMKLLPLVAELLTSSCARALQLFRQVLQDRSVSRVPAPVLARIESVCHERPQRRHPGRD